MENRAKVIMVQGLSSGAGKSLLTTALCKIFAGYGYRVAPFKSWNMSLNSYVTRDGLEISRAQGFQAETANVEATGDMNPFLLKPEGRGKTQIIMKGKVLKETVFRDVRERGVSFVEFAMPVIEASLKKLMDDFQVVVIEGAGSPAEINIKENDVANMRVALLVSAPVLLIADASRGGVIPGILGTYELLDEDEQGLVMGGILNKYDKDTHSLEREAKVLEERTGKPLLGVIPPMADTGVPEEDSLVLGDRETLSSSSGGLEEMVQVVEENLELGYIAREMGLPVLREGLR